MQAIKFVVRRSAGNFERGLVLDQVDTGQISLDLAGTAASGVAQDVSLHLARHQVTHYGRDGSSLWKAAPAPAYTCGINWLSSSR